MSHPSLASIAAPAWEDTLELARYGHAPLTVGWLHGQAFVYLWDFRLGQMTWRRFSTHRKPPRRPPVWDPFSSRLLYEAFYR